MAKTVTPKKKIPERSTAINPFYFEIGKLYKLHEECESRKLWSLAFSLKHITEEIVRVRNLYKWKN